MFGNITDDRKWKIAALGSGLSQLAMGQPVNIAGSQAGQMVQQRRDRQMLEESGILERFPPELRALLVQLPPRAAQSIIAQEFLRQPAAPKVTDDMAEYEAARAQGYQGTLQDWIIGQRQAGATVINNNVGGTGIDYGDPPKDMAWRRNPDGSVMTNPDGAPLAMVIPGTETEQKNISATVERAGAAIDRAEVVTEEQTAVEAAIELAKDIRNDPALESITGTIQGRLPAGVPGVTGGQPGADLNAKIEQLQGKTFLEAYQMLKGGGPITDLEGQKAERAMARLQRAQSAPAYKEALDDFIDAVERGAKKLGAETTSGGELPDFVKMSDEELDAWIKENGG